MFLHQLDNGAAPSCNSANDNNPADTALCVSAIFVILIGSLFGAAFPVYARRHKGVLLPDWIFFVAKYFGSGVIVATAFIHLLAPASKALRDPCLSGPITEYDWAEGISLMTIFVLVFVELMVMRCGTFDDGHGSAHEPKPDAVDASVSAPDAPLSHVPGEDHLGHSRDHVDPEDSEAGHALAPPATESQAARMAGIFILEFGVVFHSIFIGLTLAVVGNHEFATLYVVLVFHQLFEGLGLGTRLATAPWPKDKRSTPYLFALAYALSTPVSIAVGLGVRRMYVSGSQTALVVNGCFDSISAGILIYTGLVELMAHEFMFSDTMRRASLRVVLSAFGVMCLGAALMALLGKWA